MKKNKIDISDHVRWETTSTPPVRFAMKFYIGFIVNFFRFLFYQNGAPLVQLHLGTPPPGTRLPRLPRAPFLNAALSLACSHARAADSIWQLCSGWCCVRFTWVRKIKGHSSTIFRPLHLGPKLLVSHVLASSWPATACSLTATKKSAGA